MYKSVYEVREAFQRKEKLSYLFFWGHAVPKDGKLDQSCLSQWWMSNFTIDKVNYICMEQYMMAEKARLFKDEAILGEILKSHDPKTMKALGRKVKSFDQEIWKENRFDIVKRGNLAKFSQDERLKSFLISTGDKILVEASPFDRIWGIGMGKSNENVENPMMWRGQNLLGFALVSVREEPK